MNVPSSLGRLNATWPLAELTVGPTEVRLRLRGPFRLIGRERVATYEDLEGVQAVLGAFHTGGVRLKVRGRRAWYFWTPNRDTVVGAVAERGVAIVAGCPKLPFLYGKDWD